MSNRQLADAIDSYTLMIVEALGSLERQQEELAARIAFIAPTNSDIRREIEEFIASAA